MPTTSINITDQLNSWISQKVSSGDYNNASEVIREALRLMKSNDEREQLELDFLRQKVLTGVNQADRGIYSPRDIAQILAETKAALDD